MPYENSDLQMVIAEMNTHHFMFRGAGTSRETARTALLNGWDVHRRDLLKRYPERSSNIPAMNDIEQHFSIVYLEFLAGAAYRDGELILQGSNGCLEKKSINQD